MRKLIVLSAAVVLGGWLASGTAAKADVGCLCTSLGKASCTSGINACMTSGGVCLLPCDYTAPKKAAKTKMSTKKKS